MNTLDKTKQSSPNNHQLEKLKADNNKDVVEYESRDYDGDDGEAANKDDCDLDDYNDCNIEAITKEEEWITKRKTELTTTRQIETHVKRSIRFEDGKVIEDSGPIVSTNTTEDTDKQETLFFGIGSPYPLYYQKPIDLFMLTKIWNGKTSKEFTK